MLNDIILFARLSETNLASYGSRLKGMCQGNKINTVIELLRLYATDSIMDDISYCGWTTKTSLEMFCTDLLNMTPEEADELTQQILDMRQHRPLKRTYIIPRKISDWVEEIYLEFVQNYPSERIRDKFLAMYCNADRFYDTLLFHPERAFYGDIDSDLGVVKEIWQFTIYVAQYLKDNVLKTKMLTKADAFRRKCEEFVENLHICHLEAFNRLNYNLLNTRGQILVQWAYHLKVSSHFPKLSYLLSTTESMQRIIFGHPQMVWRTFENLNQQTRSTLSKDFEELYTFMADLAHHLPQENDKLYLNQMFDFLEPYQEDRVMEYIRDNDNTPILYLILAYVRSRPTGSYMDVLARFNGFFSSEQTIEQIASSLGARRNRIVAIIEKPEPDNTLSRIASYPESKRYNLNQKDWIDLTDPTILMDNDEKALVEKLNATDEALYYAISTLGQLTMLPILDRMIGIAPDLAEAMDFASAITSLWKTKFKYSETARSVKIPDLVHMHLKTVVGEVKDMERIEKVFMSLVRLFMPDIQIGYPNLIIQPSEVNVENELLRYVNVMKEISLVNLFDVFTSNYPQFNLRRPLALIPIIELSGKIGYSTRKRKFMPRGPKTVKYPTDHLKDSAIEDRSWLKFQSINGVDPEPATMPAQGTKDLRYEQITKEKTQEAEHKVAPIIKESTDIKTALQAALAISAKLTDVDSIVETSEYNSVSAEVFADEADGVEESTLTESVPVEVAQADNTVVFETESNEEPVSNAHLSEPATTDASSVKVALEDPVGLDDEEVETEVTAQVELQSEVESQAAQKKEAKENDTSKSNAKPNIADLLESFSSRIEEITSSVDDTKQDTIEEELQTIEDRAFSVKVPSLFDDELLDEETLVVHDDIDNVVDDNLPLDKQATAVEEEAPESEGSSLLSDEPIIEETQEPAVVETAIEQPFDEDVLEPVEVVINIQEEELPISEGITVVGEEPTSTTKDATIENHSAEAVEVSHDIVSTQENPVEPTAEPASEAIAEDTIEDKAEDPILLTKESAKEELVEEKLIAEIADEQTTEEPQEVESEIDELVESAVEESQEPSVEVTDEQPVEEPQSVESQVEETAESTIEDTPEIVAEASLRPSEETLPIVVEEEARAEVPVAEAVEEIIPVDEDAQESVSDQITQPVEQEAQESISEEPIQPVDEEPSEPVEEVTQEASTTEAESNLSQEVTSEASVESKEEVPAENPIVAAQTLSTVPAAVKIVAEESSDKTPVSTRQGKTNKGAKEIVVVNEPQAQMSPYRQSLVIEEKKAEEEKKEKGKRRRKPNPKPSPDLPLKENIVRLLRNSKSPVTLTNIVKGLKKAGVEPVEDDVADIIYKYDKGEFLFFTKNFIGLMEKKYNFSIYRLDSKNSQTFEYMGRAFFNFCDRNGRMPFMDNEEERFLDRWVSHLLDEKVKHTPEQMKWFRQEVVRRRGKVMNKEEWTFVENCRKYRKFYQEHKTHPNPSTDAVLTKWFARASNSYKNMSEIKRSEFDQLVEYLDQFGLFGIFD